MIFWLYFGIYGYLYSEGEKIRHNGVGSLYYAQVGDILESTSGENLIFKAVLQKEEEGYSVKKFKIAEGDGAMWGDSVIKLMKGYPEAKKAFKEESVRDYSEAERKRVISQYVKNNGLMIHYYKEYGEDKVKLSD
ncbi:MAG: hypothetical protein J1E62_07590 [Lachnospiraceae bacterium]|nr:hypothetical protein [Lachnospiraceae bacterium]